MGAGGRFRGCPFDRGRQRLTRLEAKMNVFAVRHGETAWSLSGQHTGTTDIPLTQSGRRLAERMRPVLAKEAFALVLCSPMQRAVKPARWRVSAATGPLSTPTWPSGITADTRV